VDQLSCDFQGQTNPCPLFTLLIENESTDKTNALQLGKAGETLEGEALRPGPGPRSGQLMILIGSVASQPLNFHIQHVDKSQASDNAHHIMFCI
jgi:hypothetical protein